MRYLCLHITLYQICIIGKVVPEKMWRVLIAREAAQHVAVVCCDISLGFDTADQALVTKTIQHYGTRGLAL